MVSRARIVFVIGSCAGLWILRYLWELSSTSRHSQPIACSGSSSLVFCYLLGRLHGCNWLVDVTLQWLRVVYSVDSALMSSQRRFSFVWARYYVVFISDWGSMGLQCVCLFGIGVVFILNICLPVSYVTLILEVFICYCVIIYIWHPRLSCIRPFLASFLFYLLHLSFASIRTAWEFLQDLSYLSRINGIWVR